MGDTGRISRPLKPLARSIVFGETAERCVEEEMPFATVVDEAHVIMLAERNLIQKSSAAMLLREICAMRADDFAPLRGQQAERGCYLLYERYLIDKLGQEVGGILQTARSRNDLNATVIRLRARRPYTVMLREVLRLQVVLIRRARRYADVVMPAYTHYQAAVPVTLGHYFAGLASALQRDTAALLELGAQLNQSPLGAGSIGGTSLPIDPARTARLLGFESSLLNSFDSVASRDLVLRLLAAAAILGVTLSRLCADLLLWTTAEFGFLSLPDHLVGSSSMMPQKRNPFLIEQAQGRSAAALGALVAASAAMHGTPFSNSVAVGTEAISHLWQPLRQTAEATTLLRLIVADAAPQRERMLSRAQHGYTAATELANRLAIGGGRSFRAAHREVGTLVNAAIKEGVSIETAAQRLQASAHGAVSFTGLDPASVAASSEYGGGPGPDSLQACLSDLAAQWAAQSGRLGRMCRAWSDAAEILHRTVEQFCAENYQPS